MYKYKINIKLMSKAASDLYKIHRSIAKILSWVVFSCVIIFFLFNRTRTTKQLENDHANNDHLLLKSFTQSSLELCQC